MMSKKKSEGYQNKLRWLNDRFAEGMRIKKLPLPERGYIEYMPGEHAWRAVNADGFMLIHCLWVVGKSKKQGHARALIDACVEDARRSGSEGVAMVTSEKVWMVGKKIFEAQGFECVDTAEPGFSLMVKEFGSAETPSFAGNWEAKANSCGEGLTILYTDQCPYIPDAVSIALECAREEGVPGEALRIENRQALMDRSPTPYGTYAMVLDGSLLAYHYLLAKDLAPILADRRRGT